MAKKRKSVATNLDEVDRSVYASFRSAANSLSQLYTQAMNHQKLSFQAGERQGLNELDYCGEEPSLSPRVPFRYQNQQHSQPTVQVMNPISDIPYNLARSDQLEQQSKNSVFSNALSSPVRRSLQNYQISHFANGGGGSGAPPPGTGSQNRETNSSGSVDSSVDMHSE